MPFLKRDGAVGGLRR